MRAAVLLISLAACGRLGFDPRDGATEASPDGPGVGGICNVSDVAVGRYQSCMIERGDVWCWGRNGAGQAVPGVTADYVLTPSRVTLPSPAVQVASGRTFSCARLDTGDVYCWGNNAGGALGDGTLVTPATPVQVALGGEHALDIAAGSHHVCIRRVSDQAVMCWGDNSTLATGSPTGANVPMPTLVAGTSGARELGIGHRHSCIVDVTGAARCWGRNDYGQLGTTNPMSATPMPANVPASLRAVSGGGRHTCAADMTGDLRCWGQNLDGEIGEPADNGINASASPVFLTNVTDVSAGAIGSCAVRGDGSVWCWGNFDPGDGTYSASEVPRASSLSNVEKLVVGFQNACAIEAGGQLRCWGGNARGELGRGNRDLTPTPVTVPITATRIALRDRTVCATVSGDDIRCWGRGDAGQRASGDRTGVRAPTTLAHGLVGVVGIALGELHSCAWTATAVRCWGKNEFGQAAGNTVNFYQLTATVIQGVASPLQVTVGREFTCVIEGAVTQCWGRNSVGQLGNNTTTDSATVVPVTGANNASKISAGASHACAITPTQLVCWGFNGDGQLGDGTTTNRLFATSTSLTNPTDVSAAASHTCAVANGDVFCWGDNQVGQLGTGDLDPRLSPTKVTLPMAATRVVATDEGTCAQLIDASVYCWGKNEDGQLGDGTFAGQASPLHMTAFDGVDEIVRGPDGGCVRRGTQVSCWGATELLGNGDNSTAMPQAPAGCQ